MIKSDRWIKEMCLNHKMISPFHEASINNLDDGRKIPSKGLSSYGYDVTLGNKFVLFPNQETYEYIKKDGTTGYVENNVLDSEFLDTKFLDILNPNHKEIVKEIDNVKAIIIPPRGFILGVTEEHFIMPSNVTGLCVGKSTLARFGIQVLVTPLEAGWSGYLTLEIYNSLEIPVKLHSGIGITQICFFEGDQCDTNYSSRNGKYNNQPNKPIVGRY